MGCSPIFATSIAIDIHPIETQSQSCNILQLWIDPKWISESEFQKKTNKKKNTWRLHVLVEEVNRSIKIIRIPTFSGEHFGADPAAPSTAPSTERWW